MASSSMDIQCVKVAVEGSPWFKWLAVEGSSQSGIGSNG